MGVRHGSLQIGCTGKGGTLLNHGLQHLKRVDVLGRMSQSFQQIFSLLHHLRLQCRFGFSKGTGHKGQQTWRVGLLAQQASVKHKLCGCLRVSHQGHHGIRQLHMSRCLNVNSCNGFVFNLLSLSGPSCIEGGYQSGCFTGSGCHHHLVKVRAIQFPVVWTFVMPNEVVNSSTQAAIDAFAL